MFWSLVWTSNYHLKNGYSCNIRRPWCPCTFSHWKWKDCFLFASNSLKIYQKEIDLKHGDGKSKLSYFVADKRISSIESFYVVKSFKIYAKWILFGCSFWRIQFKRLKKDNKLWLSRSSSSDNRKINWSYSKHKRI